MQRNEVILTCDVHRGVARAVETMRFFLDGQLLECDLCDAHAEELRRLIGSWAAHGRPARPGSFPKRKVSQPRGGDGPRRAKRIPVQPRAQERLERMLAAAEEVFTEIGFDGATTNQIAERSETSVGSVYNFLGSKDAIAIAIFERHLAELQPRFDELISGRGGVTGMVDLVDGFLRAHPALTPLLRHRWGGTDLRVTRRRFQDSLVAPVEQVIARQRRFADPARRGAAAELCATSIWSMVLETVDRPGPDRERRLAELKLMLAGYVGASVAAA